jgi:hypothetical protein
MFTVNQFLKEALEKDRLEQLSRNADARILFRAADNQEYLGKSKRSDEPSRILKELKKRQLVVLVKSGDQPGYPYFHTLVALIPAGAGLMVLKGLRDLILAWLQAIREREVEIKLRSGTSVRIKGTNATAKNVDDILRKLMNLEEDTLRRGTSPKAAKAASKVMRTSKSKTARKAAASALTQYKAPKEKTHPAAAKAASKVLRDGRSSKAAKRAAASTLAQVRKK